MIKKLLKEVERVKRCYLPVVDLDNGNEIGVDYELAEKQLDRLVEKVREETLRGAYKSLYDHRKAGIILALEDFVKQVCGKHLYADEYLPKEKEEFVIKILARQQKKTKGGKE